MTAPIWTPYPSTYLFDDEFDGPAGAPPDSTNWYVWNNAAASNLQPKAINTYMEANLATDGNSNLIVSAIYNNNSWTSGAMTTWSKWTAGPGTVWEARIQYEPQQGIWPAWWCLGTWVPQGYADGWPLCGEIDILEYFGINNNADSTVHTGVFNSTWMQWYNTLTDSVMRVQVGIPVVDSNWHTYRMVWTVDGLWLYQDAVLYGTIASSDPPRWPFGANCQLYQMVDFAIGGSGGTPSQSTKQLLIDYIRVWEIPE